MSLSKGLKDPVSELSLLWQYCLRREQNSKVGFVEEIYFLYIVISLYFRESERLLIFD